MDSARRDRSEITKASSSDSPRRSTPRPHRRAHLRIRLRDPTAPPAWMSAVFEITSHGTAESKKKNGKKKSNRSRKSAGRWIVCSTAGPHSIAPPRVSGMDTSSPNVSDDDEVGRVLPLAKRCLGSEANDASSTGTDEFKNDAAVWHNEGRVVPTSMWLKESHTSAGRARRKDGKRPRRPNSLEQRRMRWRSRRYQQPHPSISRFSRFSQRKITFI